MPIGSIFYLHYYPPTRRLPQTHLDSFPTIHSLVINWSHKCVLAQNNHRNAAFRAFCEERIREHSEVVGFVAQGYTKYKTINGIKTPVWARPVTHINIE